MPLVLSGSTGIVEGNIADSAITSSKIASAAAITDKLGYTPTNKAGDIATGQIIGSGVFAQSYHMISNTSYTRQNTITFTFTGTTNGSFLVTDYGYPSGTKAIFVSSFWQIDGYGGSGGSDHAVCIFGQSAPSGSWFTSSGNVGDVSAPFAFAHDGDGVSGWGTYGTWWSGLIPVNSNNRIYYVLGDGYSGGTHYVRLVMNGYLI